MSEVVQLKILGLEFDVYVRLFLAVLIGAVVGIDRELKRRPGGIKTHSLVCLGSALVMLTSEQISHQYVTTDVTRLAAQVISGIGFLGAGTILITGKNQIKGLTSAAGLWFSACMGLTIGIGYYNIAIVALVLSFIITNIFTYIDRLVQKVSKYTDLHIEFTKDVSLSRIIKNIKKENIKIVNFESYKGTTYHDVPSYIVIVQIKIKNREDLITLRTKLKAIDGIFLVEEI